MDQWIQTVEETYLMETLTHIEAAKSTAGGQMRDIFCNKKLFVTAEKQIKRKQYKHKISMNIFCCWKKTEGTVFIRSSTQEKRLNQFLFSLFLLSSTCRSICHQYVSNIGKVCTHLHGLLNTLTQAKIGGWGRREYRKHRKTLEGNDIGGRKGNFTMVSRENVSDVFFSFFLKALSWGSFLLSVPVEFNLTKRGPGSCSVTGMFSYKASTFKYTVQETTLQKENGHIAF